MNKILILLLFCFQFFAVFSQRDTSTNLKPVIMLEAQVIDFNYINYSARTLRKSSQDKPDKIDFIRAFANPSMEQSLTWTANFYAATHYGLKKLMSKKIFNKPFLDNLTKSLTWGATEYILTYMPFGNGWLHEEYHRAVLTKFYVKSYNGMNKFPIFAEAVSVNQVTDEDLIRLKAESNPDFVRLHAAGIEGEYMLAYQLQKYNFFFNQKQTYFTSSMLSILNSFAYVWMCHTTEAETFTDEFNEEEGTNMEVRDFTGLDFCAWTYDLFNPEEPYTNRGIHPSGVGIDRYIKPSDLSETQTGEQPLKYLHKQGFLELFNFINPMLWGVNRFKISENAAGKTYANFAFRHFLTSFGNDITPLVFFQTPNLNWIFAYHNYNNYENNFHGIEAEIFDYQIGHKRLKTFSSLRLMAWLQPENQDFRTKEMATGGLIDFKIKVRIQHAIFPYIQIVAKTKGWVAGNVYLEDNFSVKFGANVQLNCFTHVKLSPKK